MSIYDKARSTALAALSFMRPNAQGTVTDGSEPGAKVALYQDTAVNELVKLLTRLPDPDAVLRRAGIQRHQLKTVMYEDEIAQAVETRGDALTSTPVIFEPSEGKPAEFLNNEIKPFLESMMLGFLDARWFGYSVLEAVYVEREDGRIGLNWIGKKPMQWFSPKPDGTLRYFPADGSGGTEGILCDLRYKFFLTRCKASYENPYGEALLSRLYWPWFFRTNGWKFWGKFLERFGTPLLVGKSADPTAMVSALTMAHNQAVIGVGKDDAVDMLNAGSGGNAGSAFEGYEAAVVRRIQKVILGQTLTSGTDGAGSRALGQVHELVRADKKVADIKLVLPTLQAVVDALCELNGFERHLVSIQEEQGLEEKRAERDKKLHDIGVRFTREYFEDNYGLDTEDFEMTTEGTEPNDLNDAGTGTNEQPPNNEPREDTKQAARLFARSGKTRFTRQQEELEELADEGQAAGGQPLDTEKIRSAVLAATSPEDLSDRLFALLGDELDEAAFTKVLEQALFAADVLGYVHSAGKV